MLPFTRKMLMDWAGATVFQQGQMLFERGLVAEVEYHHPHVRGVIRYGHGSITCRFRLMANGAENECPCYDCQQRWITCAHVVATGLALLEQDARQVEAAAPPQKPVNSRPYLRRESPTNPDAVPARLHLRLTENWQIKWRETKMVPLECWIECNGAKQPADMTPTDIPLTFAPHDEAILFVLEDIAGGPAPGAMELAAADFLNLLALYAGRTIAIGDDWREACVHTGKAATRVHARLDWATGEIILQLVTAGVEKGAEPPLFIVAGQNGCVWQADGFRLLAQVLPAPLQAIYQAPMRIVRASVPRCLQVELDTIARHIPLELEFDRKIFEIVPAQPRYRLCVRGSPASLAARLLAEYGAISLPAGKPDPAGYFALPDPENILRYAVRNLEDEKRALAYLAVLGLCGENGDALTALSGTREVRNFLGSTLPTLRRRQWQVELSGSIAVFRQALETATPVVQIETYADTDWFEVRLFYRDKQGRALPAAEIQRALRKGDAFLEHGDRIILLDAEAIGAVNELFYDCASSDGRRPGTFRLAGVYAPYVKDALSALEGIAVEAPPEWQERADRQNRLVPPAPVALPKALDNVMRPYQKEGVAWLRFLEQGLFNGILADEMGLGKTLQALAWLSLTRLHPRAAGKPSLVVCPTSLVENWVAEARRFVPALRVLPINGLERHSRWQEIPKADLVITSYALLRRDIEHYLASEFAAVILDEAQHIKNRSTQNALAAKRLHCLHRLVLTGTPMENSVADLWSIMDFLMPGYLGSYEFFHRHYELPANQAGMEAEEVRRRLRRKIHPFILRRMKQQVARELPPKIEQLALCSLTPAQTELYAAYLHESRERLVTLVAERGFQRARMEILKTLLRLRQICCHLALVKAPPADARQASGKLELFLELLDEAIDGGHRVLVFSQFTSMLAILRQQLEERGMAYSYLDGSTKNRLEIVNEFNARRDIPVFLMSLKAGGTGLNLTGADMVMHFDPWWNPAAEAQAADRAHRIGQNRTVYIIKLITKGTVEEKVLEMQRRKQALIDATIAPSPENFIAKLSWEDVQKLLA